MNPLAYLYIKYKDTRQFGACPRGGIIMPIWFIILIGFSNLLYTDKIIYLITMAIIWLFLYLLIYLAIPKPYVLKHFKSWQKRYKNSSKVLAILYWIACILIAFAIFDYRSQ